MQTVQTAKCCMLHGSLHSNNHNCTHYAPLFLAPGARASRRGAITACALPVAAPVLVLRHSRAVDSPRRTHPRHREGCAASRWSGPCEGSEDCGRASPGPPPRASAAKLVFALMMSASYVRCASRQKGNRTPLHSVIVTLYSASPITRCCRGALRLCASRIICGKERRGGQISMGTLLSASLLVSESV